MWKLFNKKLKYTIVQAPLIYASWCRLKQSDETFKLTKELTNARLRPEEILWLDVSLLTIALGSSVKELDPTEFKLRKLPTPGIFSKAVKMSSASSPPVFLVPFWAWLSSGDPDSPEVCPYKICKVKVKLKDLQGMDYDAYLGINAIVDNDLFFAQLFFCTWFSKGWSWGGYGFSLICGRSRSGVSGISGPNTWSGSRSVHDKALIHSDLRKEGVVLHIKSLFWHC